MQNLGVHLGGANDSKREIRDVIHNEYAEATPTPTKYEAGYTNFTAQMQNGIGICTAEAVCSLIERFRNDGIVLSRRFTYLIGKKLIDGNLNEGSSIKSMLQGAYKYGTQPESIVPTDTTMSYGNFINFDVTPFIASAIRIPGYINVPIDSSSLSSGIYKYNGLAVRYDCGQTWWQDSNGVNSWDAAKLLPLQYPRYGMITGHAVCATGYDFTFAQEMDILNSWSPQWCLNGRGYSIINQYSPTEAWAITSTAPIIPVNPKFTKEMGYGSMGSQVMSLQTLLVKLNFGSFTPTGFFGAKTRDAVVSYQMNHSIKPTGYVGPITLGQLNKD